MTTGTGTNSEGRLQHDPTSLDVIQTPGISNLAPLANENEEAVIASIQATGLALGQRRVPAGFYTMLNHSGHQWRTENKPLLVNNSVVQWDGPIPIPSDLSATIHLGVYASFEFEPMLGAGEQLRKLTLTVEQLLDRSAKGLPFSFFPKDRDVISPCTSILFIVQRQKRESSDPSTLIDHSPHSTMASRGELEEATDQGHGAFSCYQKHGSTLDLKRAIEQFEHALNLCPLDDSCRPAALSNFAMAKFIHWRVVGMDTYPDGPLELYHDALSARPVGHIDRPSTLIQLAMVHSALFEKQMDVLEGTRAEVLLREAISLGSMESYETQAATFILQLLTRCRVDHTQQGSFFSTGQDSGLMMRDLAIQSTQLLRRSEESGNLADLDQAIALLEQMVRCAPTQDGDDLHSGGLGNLGVALILRFKHLGGLSDLDGAIARLKDAINLTCREHPNKFIFLNNLGFAYKARFERLGSFGDLESAISCYRDLVDLTPHDHLVDLTSLNELAGCLVLYLELLDEEPNNIEDAIAVLKSAINLVSYGHPKKPGLLSNLGSVFKARFERLGELEDLEYAIVRLTDAVELAPEDHPELHAILNNLGNCFTTRFQCLGEAGDLEEAIMRQRDAVSLTPRGDIRKRFFLNNLGVSLMSRFTCLGELGDLETAISTLRNAVDLTPYDNSPQPSHVNNLGQALHIRFERFGGLSDLDAAISTLRNGASLTPRSHNDKPRCLNGLGNCLLDRFKQRGDLDDLEEAISNHREAVELAPLSHPNRFNHLNNLGNSTYSRFERLGQLHDLEVAISTLMDAVDHTPHGHPNKPGLLMNLSNFLSARFKRLGELRDLEAAISMLKSAVELTSRSHSIMPLLLASLGSSLFTRFDRLGGLDDLEAATSTLKDAVGLTPSDHPDRFSRLSNLANSFSARFRRLGELSDIENAISALTDVVDIIPRGHPNRSASLDSLGCAFLDRYRRLGGLSDLQTAISMFKDAVDCTPHDHPDKSHRLNNFGNSLMSRFKRLGEIGDINDAISTLKASLDIAPQGHPLKAVTLNDLGVSFAARYEHLGELGDLNDAISKYSEAIDIIPRSHPKKPSFLNNFGQSLYIRFERFGELDDLETAILVFSDAVELTPHDHPNKYSLLNALGALFSVRFLRCGQLSDLEEAISRQRDAINLIPPDHSQKPGNLHNLGCSLFSRFEQLGDLNDLMAAVSLLSEAVKFTPDGHPNRPMFLNTLSITLLARYERLGELGNLDAAVTAVQDAVDSTPSGHPHRAGYLTNLGTSLRIRFEGYGDPRDLQDAILVHRAVIDLTPHDHPNKPSRLSNLSSTLRARFEHIGELSDLEDAISALKEAVNLTPYGHTGRLSHLSNLGLSLETRFNHLGELNDIEQAISSFATAASTTIGRISDRFHASQKWISCARDTHHHTLLHAYSVALSLLPQLAWIGLPLEQRFTELMQGADVVREAAAAALESGLLEIAIEWLEQGRSIVWGELFRLRTSHEELSSAYPDYARRLQELSTALENAGASREKTSFTLWEQSRSAIRELAVVSDHAHPIADVTLSAFPQQTQSTMQHAITTLRQEADKHRQLAIERDKLLREIRQLPGFERFLLHKQFSQLRCSTHSGPVVILNASASRCDALVVVPNVNHPIHVRLPNFTFKQSGDLQKRLKSFIREARVAEREGQPDKSSGISWESFLSPLWKCVVKPVLDALAFSVPGHLSRIFWCPTGPFSFLPIHAAGFYDEEYAQLGHKVFDFVISSYVPTLSSLGSSSRPVPVSSDLRILAVPQPSSDGQPRLPGVATELAHIKEVILKSPSACTTLLKSSVGTVEEVLGLMKDADWVHFACHGVQDTRNPTHSGLCLADERRLKISDMTALSRSRGGLAFLSACQTAKGDEGLSDEAIHIAAGMLFAGYEGVVGTMWSISDRLAPVVARDVYEQLFSKGKRPDHLDAARALHEAVGRLRMDGVSFVDWLPFIHVGL